VCVVQYLQNNGIAGHLIINCYQHFSMCINLCFQTLSEDNLTQLDEFYQLIAPTVEGEKTWAYGVTLHLFY